MASNPGAWGIDIGQAGLKAIRLEIDDATEQVVATAFDYIAHPKILSQPDAIPEELVTQALDKFLKQNDIDNDVIGISVPGQSALARFIQLPPVEASKVSEIVKYEARQQIPFALEDVVWDYQTLGRGTEESGFLLEAEVGLFAMKRDQVLNHLKTFTNAGVEVELIQIAPLALFNFLSFDQLGFRLGDESVPMDSYTILLDMGADNTMLLVSNGQKIWIRNVPIGGNHFTRALTKEMKLTFAKAEHLKCNATKSPDPRAVFQALRPIFNDYVSEIQRSIGYFSSVNREAKISKVVGLGNGFKLAGLQKFLQQNLQYEVERIDSFSSISPDGFKDAALFEENILSFPVCYGTALQGLKQTRIRTSLLPKEITTARTIARKKPWAVAAAVVLTAGLATSAFGYARVYKSVAATRFGKAEDTVKAVTAYVGDLKKEYKTAKESADMTKLEGDKLTTGLDGRVNWLELYKAIDECLPRDSKEAEKAELPLKNRIHIKSVQPHYVSDLKAWYDKLSPHAKDDVLSPLDKQAPTGDGWVVTLIGEHYHDETMGKNRNDLDPNAEMYGQGEPYLRRNFVDKLQQWTVPAHDRSGEVGVRTIGITHATVVSWTPVFVFMDPLTGKTNRTVVGLGGGGGNEGMAANLMQMGGMGGREQKEKRGEREGAQEIDPDKAMQNAQKERSNFKRLKKWTFVVEFVWNPAKKQAKPPAGPAAGAVAAATPVSGAPAK